MGWYHYQTSEDGTPGEMIECPDGTCSLPKKEEHDGECKTCTTTIATTSSEEETKASEEEEKKTEEEQEVKKTAPRIQVINVTQEHEEEELYHAQGTIYHLCQRKLWLEAVRTSKPYYPPTFWKDGKFTRFSCEPTTLVDTANHYYGKVAGDWICLEIKAESFRKMGIPIVAQRAPESSPNEPIQCLKVYSGIPVESKKFVVRVYKMNRRNEGLFLSMEEDRVTPKGVYLKPATGNRPSSSRQPPVKEVPTKQTKKKWGFFSSK